jgi:acyl-coenzyme A thioesterase PaaI-like protein
VPASPDFPLRDIPGFDGLYGLEIDAVSDERIAARVAVRDELRQTAGLLHGG